jgi:3-dehydroquinate synthetase
MSRLRRVSKLQELKSGPRGLDPNRSIVMIDARVARLPGVKAWLSAFPFRRVLRAGEDLKTLSSFQREVEFWQSRWGAKLSRDFRVVAIGGGSVGDFAGFVASVYWRGLQLIHVPTTWLAALDSAHGGKTALNVGGAKNQIGSFHPAEEVILLRELLAAQPPARAIEARGELLKMALLDGGAWTQPVRAAYEREFRGEQPKAVQDVANWEKLIWKCLPSVVEAKLRVVRRDPREQTGVRQILNLGHTWGHVLEAAHNWSHGRCVELGLHFADEYFSSDFCAEAHRRVQRVLPRLPQAAKSRVKVTRAEALARLARDKKRSGSEHVVMIQALAWGKARRVRVELRSILDFAAAEGWLK